MKILITGIAGFIGAWLASLLSRYGYEVFGIDMEDNKLRNEIFLKGCGTKSDKQCTIRNS